MGFGARMAAATAQRGRLCVGIDPHPELLQQWGLSVDAQGLASFAHICVDAFADTVAVVKPQSALFEVFGSAGVLVLEQVLAGLRAGGALSILDVKRGDIGSTMDAYARAYLADGAPLAADAITASPFLGFGSLRPAIELAKRTDRGVFVLARTSNPEGASVQCARTESGHDVAQSIVDSAAEANADGSAAVGLVIGATIGAHELELSRLNGPILAPGLGAQGAGLAELAAVFADADAVLPSSSREILRCGPDVQALRDAVLRVTSELD